MKKLVLLFCFIALSTIVYAQEKEYTLNIDAIWDKVAETMRDAGGSPITGIVKSYHENGNVKFEFPYKDGKRNGITKRYDENGIISIRFIRQHFLLLPNQS